MLKVFAADQSDLDWMFRLYLHAARKGHFAMRETKAERELVKKNLLSVIEHQKMVDFNLRAQALVFETEHDRVGYLLMSEIKGGQGGNELHLFVVDKKMRGHGFGRYMLDEVVRRWHPFVDIYARVYPVSVQMEAMLAKVNFRKIGENREGADIYVLNKLATVLSGCQ